MEIWLTAEPFLDCINLIDVLHGKTIRAEFHYLQNFLTGRKIIITPNVENMFAINPSIPNDQCVILLDADSLTISRGRGGENARYEPSIHTGEKRKKGRVLRLYLN